MKTHIIQIGNSKGIRIPKVVLDQCGFKETVSLTVKDHSLLITSIPDNPRKDWESFAKKMSKQKDDSLLDESIIDHSWDEDEWEW